MVIEIIIASVIVISAIVIFYKKITKKTECGCNCADCPSHCGRGEVINKKKVDEDIKDQGSEEKH